MTLNSEEFVEAIIEHASSHGFPVDTDRQPNFWKITEKGGSFETRFTQMLCWYLDPKSNHGLGGAAIQRLLDIATVDAGTERIELDPLSTKVIPEAYTGYKVKGKFGKLDSLIIDENNKILVAIEVKMGAEDHDGQLQKYYESISQDSKYKDFPEENRFFIYLTTDGRESKYFSGSSDDEKRVWVSKSYSLLSDLLEFSLDSLHSTNSQISRNSQRVIFLLEDFYILVRSKSFMHHGAIREKFLNIETDFIIGLAQMVLALGISPQSAIKERMVASKYHCANGEIMSREFFDNSLIFRQEVEELYAFPEVPRNYPRETKLESIIKFIWQVLGDKTRGTTYDLDRYIEMDNLAGVKNISEWLRDRVHDNLLEGGERKLLVQAQNERMWPIKVGDSSQTMPNSGLRKAYVTFTNTKQYATIHLEPFSSSKNHEHEKIRALCPELFEKLDELIEYKTDQADRRIRIKVTNDGISMWGPQILELLRVTCSYR